MITIDEHTFDETLLTNTSMVLDVGCRGFGFAKWITKNIGCPVVAIDADPNIIDPKLHNVSYINACVTNSNAHSLPMYLFGNGTANYSAEVYDKPSECEVVDVRTYRIQPFWDLIKLDCEGAEYNILFNMQEPLARQISVEFHEHTPAARGDEYMNALFNKLSQWYNVVNAKKYAAHGCSANYWDVLFKLKP